MRDDTTFLPSPSRPASAFVFRKNDGLDGLRIAQVPDPSRIDIAPGFVAVNRSMRMREALARMIDLGGTVFGALLGPLLVGYVADVPYAGMDVRPSVERRRWQTVSRTREGVIEVARGFRRAGIARRLLAEATSIQRLDRDIVVGEGLIWHWDLRAEGLSASEYRTRLLALLFSSGFAWYDTNEPEITTSEHNFIVARIGPDVPPDSRRAFEAALFS